MHLETLRAAAPGRPAHGRAGGVAHSLRRVAASVAALALALGSAFASASVGLTELPATATDGPVTVFYPSSGASAATRRGPFTVDVAAQGAVVPGNGRLVIISHGSGGHPMVQADLARYLVLAGYIVALPEHTGDNWHDMGKVGPESWKLRPLEVSRAIDAMVRDPRFGPLFDAKRVGMFGMSAGGHTALTLAGGHWSRARLREHCEAHLADDFVACTGAATELEGNALDAVKKAVALPLIRRNLAGDEARYGHTDARIRAVVAGVPFAADFDPASLASPAVPLGIVQAEQDRWLVPRFHSMAVLASCRSCETLASMPTAGHGALLSPLPPEMSGTIGRMLADPAGFDRAELPAVYARIEAFLRKHLAP